MSRGVPSLRGMEDKSQVSTAGPRVRTGLRMFGSGSGTVDRTGAMARRECREHALHLADAL
jgi:hypothetical protein